MNKKDRNRRNLSRRDFVQNSAKVVIGAAILPTILPTILPSCSNRKGGVNDKITTAYTGEGGRVNQASAVPIWGASPIVEPYPYVSRGSFSGPAVPASPDPLVRYRWPNPKPSDGLEIYLRQPESVTCDPTSSFTNL